jgi:hypothetical protein
MDLIEFVNAVIPTVGDHCPVLGCTDWVDHVCADGVGRCLTDCWCAELAAEDVCTGPALWP